MLLRSQHIISWQDPLSTIALSYNFCWGLILIEALGGAEEEQESKEKPSLKGFIVLSKLFQKSICGNPTKGMLECLILFGLVL